MTQTENKDISAALGKIQNFCTPSDSKYKNIYLTAKKKVFQIFPLF